MATSSARRTQTIVILKTPFGYRVFPGRVVADLVADPDQDVAFANLSADPIEVEFGTPILVDAGGKTIERIGLEPVGTPGFRQSFGIAPGAAANRYEYSVRVPRLELEAEGGSRPDIIIVR